MYSLYSACLDKFCLETGVFCLPAGLMKITFSYYPASILFTTVGSYLLKLFFLVMLIAVLSGHFYSPLCYFAYALRWKLQIVGLSQGIFYSC